MNGVPKPERPYPEDEVSAASPRPPSQAMGLRRAGAATATALSFSRTAMRELVRGRWRIEKDRIELDAEGRGEILYRLVGHGWTFHFFLISTKLPEEQKLDRNFAQSWDAMGLLCQGDWTPEREAHLRVEIPKQRAGRADYDTLMYARGNRSGRLFDHVVDSLAAGRQPDAREIARVGYILRTTAFIGNGQLGTRPLAGFEPDHPMRRPYHAQIWSAFLLREYVFDLVDHMARARNPAAARLDPAYRRYLGLGNSAATGLVHFLGNHPHLIDRWCRTTEVALAEARAREVAPGDVAAEDFERLVEKAIRYFREGRQEDDGVFAGGAEIADDLVRVAEAFGVYRRTGAVDGTTTAQPWQALHRWVERHLGAEALEVFDAIVLELYPEIVERHADGFLAEERFTVDPTMRLRTLRSLLDAHYDWALSSSGQEASYYFWYRSTQAPRDVRRGIRTLADGFDRESPVDITLRVRELRKAIAELPLDRPVAELVSAHPSLRHIVARVQSLAEAEYGELRVDYLSRDFSPFAPIRFLLSFYGMEKFEAAAPKSVRGAFLQGAPIAEDVLAGLDGEWPFPLLPGQDVAARARPSIAPLGAECGTTDAAASASRGSTLSRKGAPSPDWVTVAPIELARLAQGALHAGGASFGVAGDAAAHVVFEQATSGTGVETLLRELERGLAGAASPEIVASTRHLYAVDAHGASAMLVGPSAIDLAITKSAQGGLGAAIVANLRGADAVAEIALRCADRGLLALLMWDGERAGYALAAPSAPAPFLVRAPSRDAAPLHRALQAAAGADRMSSRLEDALLAFRGEANGLAEIVRSLDRSLYGETLSGGEEALPGLTLVCRKLDPRDDPRLLFDAMLRRQGDRRPLLCWDASQTAANRAAWHRRGLRLAKREFEAIAAADARTLVPAEEEFRLRPGEGTDPLKVF